jgi:hypothetical protein
MAKKQRRSLSYKIRVALLASLVFALGAPRIADAQEAPELYGVSPQEGQAGTEVKLVLDGTGFFALEGLDGAFIDDLEVPILDYAIVSNESMEALIFIPLEIPTGETEISFLSGNYRLDAYFVVTRPDGGSPQPVIAEVFPREGQAGTEVELRLNGEVFSALEELKGVVINGVEVPVLDIGVESGETVFLRVRIPEEIPTGEGEIDIFFGNAEYAGPFFVAEPGSGVGPGPGTEPGRGGPEQVPPPPSISVGEIILILVIGFIGLLLLVAVPIGLIVTIRRLSKGKPKRQDEKRIPEPESPTLEFEVEADPGVQQIEGDGQPIKMEVELSFIVSVDSGEQSIELQQGRLVESE